MGTTPRNEGEGNKTADRNYREATRNFVQSERGQEEIQHAGDPGGLARREIAGAVKLPDTYVDAGLRKRPAALIEHVDAVVKPVACLLVDEAQFLEPAQVDDLLRIAVLQGVPVMAYGIRTDFRTDSFHGTARHLELAHSLEELKTICRCGRKAIFNTRKVVEVRGDEAVERFIFEGDQVAIDGVEVTYESLCGVCYLEESGGRLG